MTPWVAAAAAVPSGGTQQATQHPCFPSQALPAAQSFLSVVLDTVIKPTCPNFWKTFHFGFRFKASLAENIWIWCLTLPVKELEREEALIYQCQWTVLCSPVK